MGVLKELIWVPWLLKIMILFYLGNDGNRGKSAVIDPHLYYGILVVF